MIPTTGTIVGFVLIALGAALIAATAWFLKRRLDVIRGNEAYSDHFTWSMAAVVSGAFAAPFIICPLIGFSIVGWDSDYLLLKPVSGAVQEIASRQIADGKAMSTRYVAVIDGEPYGIDDTRAALVKPGDVISLNCTRQFVYGSTDNGFACNWGGKQ